MDYILQINNPKTGWAHAEEKSVGSPEEAYAIVKTFGRKKMQFGLQCTPSNNRRGKLFMLLNGEFKGVSDNEPLWLWLTNFGVSK